MQKRKRLVRNRKSGQEDSQVKKEIEVQNDGQPVDIDDGAVKIDTGNRKSLNSQYKSEYPRENLEYSQRYDVKKTKTYNEDSDFGNNRDVYNNSTLPDIGEAFNADEIDDPFTTPFDKEVAEKDIPERLQIKLKDRMQPTDAELIEEAHWILDRLVNYSTVVTQGPNQTGEHETKFVYQRLLRQ